jgi:hypothetical protein
MIHPTLLLAAFALLIPTAARAQTPLDPCSLLTPDQIKAVLNSPVEPGQPGIAKRLLYFFPNTFFSRRAQPFAQPW